MILQLEQLDKHFGETVAVSDLSLAVERGEFLTLLGPSGCGKTTTLRMIAGFETPTRGRIVLAGIDVTRLPPQRRGVGMVFQNYALFPHLNVAENLAFGLRAQGAAGADIAPRMNAALERVGLGGYAQRRVQQLSGGQQQRVALARALISEPPLLLLDEPLSNLDAALRERTRSEIRALLKRLGMTAVFVTHDQEEAFAMSDRIAILDRGRLQQLGTPEQLYHSPANEFVAAFLGRANFLEATITGERTGGVTCEVAPGAEWEARGERIAGTGVRLLVRPEDLQISGADEEHGLAGEIIERRFAGSSTLYRVRTGARELLVTGEERDGAVGDKVRVTQRPGHPAYVLPAAKV